MILTRDAVSGLLDEWCPELTVNNAIMSPISVYKGGGKDAVPLGRHMRAGRNKN